jgi:OmpA-OmpF porin, OOP family
MQDMANTFLESLVGMLDARSVDTIAGAIGSPEHLVSQGLKSSIAALLGGLASKSQDTGLLRNLLNLGSSAGPDMNVSQIVRGASDPDSPLLSVGRHILSGLFGNGESNVAAAVAGSSGLPTGAASKLLALAAPLVMSFLGRQAREQGMSMDGLSGRLQAESSTIRNALPASLRDQFWPAASTASAATPVVAQEVYKARSTNWLWAIPIALGLSALWFLLPARRPPIQAVTPPTGSASRVATPVCALPTNLNLPAGGVESRLVGFLQNYDPKLAPNTWFTFDRLVFGTGSAKLSPESQAQLHNVAAILKNCPTTHVKVGGYTDNVGSAGANQRLSRDRADSVRSELISDGVATNCVTAEGYGQESPIADNATADGRAKNRRVAMIITER